MSTFLPCLPPHRLKVVLVAPEIPQNAGNIARLCAVTGAELHLVRPLGFFLTEKHWRRAGMDYIEQIKLVVHDDLAALRLVMGESPYWLASSKANQSYWDVSYGAEDWLILGKESAGLPVSLLAEAPHRQVQLPMCGGARCLNLSTAAGILLYEALRQVGRGR